MVSVRSSEEHQLREDPHLLDLMIKDSDKSGELYRPGAYWRSKTRAARREIRKYGIKDFRGSAGSIATSFGDNAFVDVRGTYNFGARALLPWLFRNVFPFRHVFDEQVSLTKGYFNTAARLRSEYLLRSERARALLDTYAMPADNCRGGCQAFAEVEGSKVSHLYWQVLDTLDQVHRTIDIRRRRSFFEIGGGFGINVHLLLENFPNVRKIAYLDIPPNLYVGTQYLRSFYGSSVKSYDQMRGLGRISFADDDDLEILCIMPHQVEKLEGSFDVFHNAHSFVEMPSDIVANYAAHAARLVPASEGVISLVSYMTTGEGKTIGSDKLPTYFDRKFSRRVVETLDPKWSYVHFTAMQD